MNPPAVHARRALVAALALVVAGAGLAPALAKPKPNPKPPPPVACTDRTDAVHRIAISVAGQPAWGLVAYPSSRPRGLVVFFHGYGHTVESWRRHLARVAAKSGVVTVAMNYRGQQDSPPARGATLPSSRGWRVREGAADSVAVAQLLDRRCRGFQSVVAYGVSMGGNSSGLAVATPARRSSGRPLFDWWIDVEGATNVMETYVEAKAVEASGNTFAANARADIEAEMGGPFDRRRDVYAQHTVVLRAPDIKAAGLRGAVLVHGVMDGLVPYNQSREMTAAMRAAGVPVDLYTVTTRTDTEPGTTVDGYATGSVPGFTSPFAGHGTETDEKHLVHALAFDVLADLLRGRGAPDCRERFAAGTVDGGSYLVHEGVAGTC